MHVYISKIQCIHYMHMYISKMRPFNEGGELCVLI